MENTSAYSSINSLQEILEYLDKVDGFRDFSLGRMDYDSAFQMLTIGIEEVLDDENWPEESNGRVWFLKFGSINNIKIDIDAPIGLWASDMYVAEDGNFVIESNQGTITVNAGVVELQIPAGAENGIEMPAPAAADDAPLSFKGLFNDIKNTITGKSSQPAAKPEAQPTSQPDAQPVQPAQPADPWVNPQPAPVEVAQPVAQPAPAPVAQQPVTPAQPIETTPPIQPDDSGTTPDAPVFG